MQSVQEKTPESSWFFDALGEIGDFAGRLLRNFFKVLLTGALFTLAVLAAVYIGTTGGPGWRTPTILSTIFLLCGAVTLAMAGNLAVVLSLAQTVRAKRLAQRVFDALFAELLGVTDENPQGTHEQMRALHGMPIPKLREKLNQAGKHILDHPIAASLPKFVRWLFRKAESVLVWATVRVIISYATAKADADRKVDLLALRENLAALVDDMVTRRITSGAIRLALIAAVITTGIVWLLVEGLVRLSPG
jgi:hypothetical protein